MKKKEITKRNMLKSKLLKCNFWSRVDYHVEGKFLLLFSDVIQISLGSKRFQSSYSFFALVPTFSTNSRGKACNAGYIQISDTI